MKNCCMNCVPDLVISTCHMSVVFIVERGWQDFSWNRSSWDDISYCTLSADWSIKQYRARKWWTWGPTWLTLLQALLWLYHADSWWLACCQLVVVSMLKLVGKHEMCDNCCNLSDQVNVIRFAQKVSSKLDFLKPKTSFVCHITHLTACILLVNILFTIIDCSIYVSGAWVFIYCTFRKALLVMLDVPALTKYCLV